MDLIANQNHTGTGNRPHFQRGYNMGLNDIITGGIIILAFLFLIIGIVLYDSGEGDTK